MGRIIANVRIKNLFEPENIIHCDVLEQSQVAVDLLGHRLVYVIKTDLK